MSIDEAVRAEPVPGSREGRAPGLVVLDRRVADHPWMAALHVDELPHGLFPRLGARFVERWHRAHADSPHAVTLVALQDGVPVGFVLGSTDRRAHVDWVLEHRRGTLVAAAARALLVRPRVLADFVRSRGARYARRLLGGGRPTTAGSRGSTGSTGSSGTATDGSVAVLEAIIVMPEVRGRGVGTDLTGAFLATVAAAGAERTELVTMDGDDGAAGFYERRSWQQVGRHANRDGRSVLTFGIDPRRGDR